MPAVERTCPRCRLVFTPRRYEHICPACAVSTALADDPAPADSAGSFWDDDPPTQSPSANPRTFSHFDLVDELGRGGMGTVYKARDLSTGRTVALKVLQSHHLAEPDLVQRFRSEVRAISSLDHRHILPIHEVGEHNGIPFFSMKLATGGSLAHRLGDFLRQPRPAAQLLAKIARGVQHAHERGILHRDLKPGNILLDDAGEPYVCDFGLAKWIDDEKRHTRTSVGLGTPHYVAPEQAEGKQHLTIAADTYSLGAILYELLTGRPPFAGETALATLSQAARHTPARPGSLVSHTPRDLETICLKALERDPAARYPTAAALADDLERWLDGRPIRARPVSAAEQLWRWARRNPLPATLAAALFLALTIGSAVSVLNITRARNRAVGAEKESREQLYAALLAQARASTQSSLAGHRTEALEAIKKAAAIRPSLELRNAAIAALTLVDLKVVNEVKSIDRPYNDNAFDAALETVATVTETGDINVLSLTDGSLLRTIPGVGKPIVALLHSGSRYLALRCIDDSVHIIESATGEYIARYTGRKMPMTPSSGISTDCTFSFDETLLTLSSPDGIEIIEVATGKEIARLNTTQPQHCSFSPTDQRLALGRYSEKQFSIWNFANADSLTHVPLAVEPCSFAWTDDGQTLAVGCVDDSIQLFRTRDWQNIGALKGHPQRGSRITFNHSGTMLASIAMDGVLRLWDLRTRTQLVERLVFWPVNVFTNEGECGTVGACRALPPPFHWKSRNKSPCWRWSGRTPPRRPWLSVPGSFWPAPQAGMTLWWPRANGPPGRRWACGASAF